jgi:hypothetical protein
MANLSEYIKLRTEQKRELSWGEVDSNFLYVANPWSPTRYYKEGYIVYHDADGTGGNGLSWYIAVVDNGPSTTFNIADWEAIGAASTGGSTIDVSDGITTSSVNTLTFNSDDFGLSVVGNNANITINESAIKWWLLPGDPALGTGSNNQIAVHIGQVFIGSGIHSGIYKFNVYGTSRFTGNIALNPGVTIDGVDVSILATDYNAHTHTIVPTTLTNYSVLYPNSNNQLEDIQINTGTLATGHTLSWDNALKKWVNLPATAAALSGLTDVQIGALANNQVLLYNNTLSKWQNTTIFANGTTGLSAPFSHNHNTVYFTKTQLTTSGGGGTVHWNNVTSKPTDTSSYIVASTYGGPFTNTAYRVLQSTDGSITIDTSVANVIDLSAASSAIIDVYEEGSLIGAYAGLDFISNSFGGFTVTGVTSSAATIELVDPKVSVLANGSLSDTVHNLDFADTTNVTFTLSSGGPDIIQIEAISRGIVGVQQPSPSVITTYNTPRLNLAFKDNTEITWTVIDQAGTDTVAVEANLVSPNEIEVYTNGSFQGSFTGIDFADGTGTAVNSTSSTGGSIEIQIDTAATLDDVCLNGYSTNTPIEITGAGSFLELTQPADVSNPSAPAGCIILASPNGTRFAITVDDFGNLITTQF